MIPLVLAGLFVLVLASMGRTGSQPSAVSPQPVVPPAPPPPSSTVVYVPTRLERAETAIERAQEMLREAEEAEARNRAELESIERDWRNR